MYYFLGMRERFNCDQYSYLDIFLLLPKFCKICILQIYKKIIIITNQFVNWLDGFSCCLLELRLFHHVEIPG